MRSEEIVDRVRELIGRSGMGQGEFAEAVGLDGSKLTKSLKGERRFTSLNLANIAQHSGVTVDWLLGTEAPTPALAARHDSSADVEDDGTRFAIAKATEYAQLRADLHQLGYPQTESKFVWSDRGRSPVTDGEKLAAAAVQHLRAQNVDHTADRSLVELVESAFGVDIAVVKAPGFDGLTWQSEFSRLIMIGTSSIPGRRRFTIAHELAHLLVGDDQELNIENPNRRRHPTEVRANTFAASFLMPEDKVVEHLAGRPINRESFAEVSCKLFVTPTTLAWRLYNLNLINAEQRRAFGAMRTIEAAVLGGESSRFSAWIEASLVPRIPKLLIEDTGRAYLDGKTTLRPFANLVGVDVRDLRDALEAPRSERDSDVEELGANEQAFALS